MTELVIVADDLTGAGDSAAYLARTASVSVVLDGHCAAPSSTTLTEAVRARYAALSPAPVRSSATITSSVIDRLSPTTVRRRLGERHRQARGRSCSPPSWPSRRFREARG